MNEDRFCSVQELPALTSLSVRTWRTYIAEELLPHYRVGSRVLVRWSEVVAFLEGFRSTPSPKASPSAQEQAKQILSVMCSKEVV
jgi:excisionase family DNA binding protein